MTDRKQWQWSDEVSEVDLQRFENKPTSDEVKDMVETGAGTLITDHVEDKVNPHNVTAEQTGAYTKEKTDEKDKYINDHFLFLGTQEEVDNLSETERNAYQLIGVLENA